MKTKSEFTGGLIGLLGTNILVFALFVFTLGLGLPWCVCIKQSWLTRHTVIDGRRLAFDGTGIQLIGNWIKWWLLCFLTLGIYGFWMTIKVRQWTVKHTHFIDVANDGYDAAVPVPVPMSRQGSGRSAPNGSDPTSIRIVPLIGAIVLTLCAVYFIGSRLVAPKIEQGHLEQDVPETNCEAKSPSLEFEEPPPSLEFEEPPSLEEIDRLSREADARRAARRAEMEARDRRTAQEIVDQTLQELHPTSREEIDRRAREADARRAARRAEMEAREGRKLDLSSAWRALEPSTPSPVEEMTKKPEEKTKKPETFTVNVKIADPKRSRQSPEND